MLERLTSKDYRLIALCLVAAILSLFIIVNYFYKAFPEASIDFRVTQKQSQQIAGEWLSKLTLDPTGYRHASIFDYDSEAKTFLEKELGAEQANRLMGDKVRLWRYSHRWYKALQKEEFSMRISPKGEFLGFSHDIPEELVGAHLPAASARLLASDFLQKTVGLDTTQLEFIEHMQTERPSRLDHRFVWKRIGFSVREADYRYRIVVQGDRVDGFSEFLHVPERWSRDYQKLRAKNETAGTVSVLLLFLTMLAMLAMFIVHIRHRDIRWKTALIFGLIAFSLTLLTSLNNLPIDQYGFPTTDSFSSLITRTLLNDLLTALGYGLLIFFLTAAAEPLYREQYPDKPSLTNLFRWRGLRSKHFFNAVIVGVTLTFFFAAYQILFYLVSRKFGGWAPQEIPYDNMLNTAFPWVFVLFMGFIPSVSEEFMSRMFSIPFLQKFTKVRWLAIVLPAFIWGFGHANYPQQPFYIRGLEVGLAGVLIGLVMLRFGILATLVWHYCVDALFTAVLLFRSGNLYFILTAAVGCGLLLAPLIIAVVAYRRKGGFASEDDLSNAREGIHRMATTEKQIAEPLPTSDYHRLPLQRIAWGLLIGLLLCLLYLIPAEKPGGFVQFPSSAEQAEQAALQFARQQGFKLDDYERVTSVSERFDPIVAKYVLQNAGLARLNQLYEKESRGSRWQVRFFKPLQREEYRFYLDPRDLSLVSFLRTVEEDAPGANLDQDAARAIATAFARSQGLSIEEMVLKEGREEKRKNRTDHTFTWEAAEGDPRNLKELKFRCTIDVQGDVTALYTTFVKIPEAYERDREKRTLFNHLLIGLRILLIGGLAGLAILQLVRIIRQGTVNWRSALLWAAPVASLVLVDRLTQMHQMLAGYPTSISIDLFRTTAFIGVLISVIGVYVAAALLLALCFSLYPRARHILSKPLRREWAFDAVLASIIALLLRYGFRRASDLLTEAFSQHALFSGLDLPQIIEGPLPWLSALTGSLTGMIFSAGLTAVAIFMLQTHLPDRRWWPALVLLFAVAMIPGATRTGVEALLSVVLFLLSIAWIVISLIWFGGKNLLFYPLVFFLVQIFDEVTVLLHQDQAALALNGLGLILLLCALIIWLLWPTLSKTGAHSDSI
ncbi:MAG TPA: CPBP family intramembrane metalloprotease [bacterium]|nr:CPBP family intramembrane metalloprotease [bacterium]